MKKKRFVLIFANFFYVKTFLPQKKHHYKINSLNIYY